IRRRPHAQPRIVPLTFPSSRHSARVLGSLLLGFGFLFSRVAGAPGAGLAPGSWVPLLSRVPQVRFITWVLGSSSLPGAPGAGLAPGSWVPLLSRVPQVPVLHL